MNPGLAIPDFVPTLALATAIGLLIGFERGWQLRDEPDGQRVAGVRTFAMLGLLGGITGLLMRDMLAPLAMLLLSGTVAALLIGHVFDMRQSKVVSATSAVAAMGTLLLGALATTGHAALASTSAAVLVALLAARKPLHSLIASSNADEFYALIRLALITFLILPVLPDVGLGPYASLNPRKLWFVVVIIGVLSFGGYVLQRWLGRRRGGLLTAATGSIVSSTAVTVACARQLRDAPSVTAQAGIALGSSVMMTRTLLLVAVLAPDVLAPILWLVAPALAVSLIATGALVVASGRDDAVPGEMPVKPPGLGVAFLFAALVALVSLAAAALSNAVGSEAGTAIIIIGGMVDVDSAIAAIGALPPGTIPLQMAAIAVALPVAFNSLLKLGVTWSVAGPVRGRWAIASLASTFVIVALSVLGALLL